MAVRLLVHGRVDPACRTWFDLARFPGEWEAVAPVLEALRDPDGIRARFGVTRTELLPWPLIERLFDLGVFSLLIPRERGGVGATMRGFAEVIAALAEVEASAAVTVVPHTGMGVKSLLLFGSEAHKDELLNGLAANRRMVAFALTEPEAGSDVANHFTSLTKLVQSEHLPEADGRVTHTYQLNGGKTWITNGSWAKAIVVCAKCPDLSKIPGGSVFVLLYGNEPGLRISNPYDKLGLPGTATSQLFFEGVEVDESRLMGQPGRAVQHFNQLVDTGRMGVAAGALGLLRRAWRTVQSLCDGEEERAVVDCAAELRRLHALVTLAARAHDLEAPDVLIYTALVKNHLSERLWELLQQWIDELGAARFFSNATLREIWLDASVLRITEGPNEVLHYRAGLDLVMSLNREAVGETELARLLAPQLRPWAESFELLLADYARYVAERVSLHRSFLERQLELERICRATTGLLALLALLLLENARLEQGELSGSEALDVSALDWAAEVGRALLAEIRCFESAGDEEALMNGPLQIAFAGL